MGVGWGGGRGGGRGGVGWYEGRGGEAGVTTTQAIIPIQITTKKR